ncbi:MAG: adenylate/guanylate cyclase domain-containing protein [Candidatus Nanopelagicales bacterium]
MTSILFGDLVGFTPLSESKDSEEVRELLSAYFQQCRVIVGRYGGVIEKFIGDAVMAVWGVPVAHEDDAERAVRAGLELVAMVAALGEQVGAPELAQRVGIVTGEVAVTVGATAEGMVAGDAVNTAARVQSAAAPGRVWVDDATRSLAATSVTFADCGEHELKGKVEPVRLWQAGVVVAEVGGGQRVDGLEAPFTGRDADLRLVKELFHATEESGRPRLVVLDGEAGVGKSRLAWEFEKYIDGLSAVITWHRSRCLSYGDGVAFWALAEAVRTRLGLVEADTGDIVSERLDVGLRRYVSNSAEAEWLRPRLAVLLGEAGTSSFPREDLFAAWTAFFEGLNDGGSAVVLLLDDAQHADEGLLDFLDHLLTTARSSIFVLAVARPELLARRPALGGRRAAIVRLEPLVDDAMATLVDGLVADLPSETRAALVDRAEGIPLFAVETVRALIDRDLVVPRDGRYVTAGDVVLDLDAIGAPATLQALVAARLDALDPDDRRVLADASVLGLSFTRDGLLALGAAPETLDPALDSLRRRELLTVDSDRFSSERGQYRFVQSVVRQVAYATQSRRDRKARHLAAAAHLAGEPDPADDLAVVIAQHLLDAISASPDADPDLPELHARAALYLERAAARAAAIGAPTDAQRLLEVALAQTDDRVDLARLHLAAAGVANLALDSIGAREHAATATDLYDELGDDIRAGRAAAMQARAMLDRGENAAAIELAEPRWSALDGRTGSDPALLDLAQALVPAYMRLGDFAALGLYGERQLLLAEGLDDRAALASALNSLGLRYQNLGALRASLVNFEAAARLAREHDLLNPLARVLTNLGSSLNSRDLTAALVSAREATEVARRAGHQSNIDFSLANQLIALWQTGDLAGTRSALHDALESTTDVGIRSTLRTIEVWLADATGQLLPGPDDDYLTGIDDETTLAWQDSADVMRAVHDGDEARTAALASESMTRIIGVMGLNDDFCVLWPPLVRAALVIGDLDLVDQLLEPVESALPGVLSPAVAAHWHRLRGLASAARGDDPAFAETEMRNGIAALDAFGARGFHAQAQEELGHWLVGQQRPDDAAPLFESARATYAEIGAEGWLAKLDARDTGRQDAPTR